MVDAATRLPVQQFFEPLFILPKQHLFERPRPKILLIEPIFHECLSYHSNLAYAFLFSILPTSVGNSDAFLNKTASKVVSHIVLPH